MSSVESNVGRSQNSGSQVVDRLVRETAAAQAIGSYGTRINKRHNIDRLASEGTRLTNTFVRPLWR